MTELTQFRQQIDEFMGHHPQSPLDPNQRHQFAGLAYYAEDDNFIFEGEVVRYAGDQPAVAIETNTGETRHYRPWGRFTFTVAGEQAELTIYDDGHGFFVPFRDGTSGKETYGAGRYLDSQRPAIQHVSGDTIRIDFNYAYNPYCAYNLGYSCPLPPAENWLKVPIRAGQKDFT